MNPRSTSTRQAAEDAGLGSPPRQRGWLRRAAGTGLVASVAIGLLMPTVAHADGGKTPEIVGLAYYVNDDSRCYVRPNDDSRSGPLSPRTGNLYEVSSDSFRGPSNGDATDIWRWVQERGNPSIGCFVVSRFLSSVLPGDPGEIEWRENGAMMGEIQGSGPAAALVTSAEDELVPAPTTQVEALADPDAGTVFDYPVDFAAWTIVGDTQLAGSLSFVPVRLDGVVAWARAGSVTPVPEVSREDLTGSLEAPGALDVMNVPSPLGQVIGTLAAGETALTYVVGTAGYQPVATPNGQVGWVSQAAALEAAIVAPTQSATPTAEATSAFAGIKEDAAAVVSSGASVIGDATEAVGEKTKQLGDETAKRASMTLLMPSLFLSLLALLGVFVSVSSASSKSFRASVLGTGAGICALPAGLAAAAVAPAGLFPLHVAIGTAAVGSALGLLAASTVTSVRHVPLAGLTDIVSNTCRLMTVLVAGSAPVASALLAESLDWPVGLLLGLILAGTVVGFLVKPERAPVPSPAHPLVEAAPAAPEPSFESGW